MTTGSRPEEERSDGCFFLSMPRASSLPLKPNVPDRQAEHGRLLYGEKCRIIMRREEPIRGMQAGCGMAQPFADAAEVATETRHSARPLADILQCCRSDRAQKILGAIETFGVSRRHAECLMRG